MSGSPRRELPATDLREILQAAREDVLRFRGSRLYVTGGTGFVGIWFLASVAAANRSLEADISVDVLTRDPERAQTARPEIFDGERIRLVRGDVTERPPVDGTYDAIVHAATAADARLNAEAPDVMLSTIVDGGRHVLELAARAGAIPLLFTSSGAVYGRQPPTLEKIDETYGGAPNTLDAGSAYAEGKRLGELQCSIAAKRGAEAKIARLFAFAGPLLPLDRHFAIGNFLRDAMAGNAISIGGDGSPFRSYLYASEMTAWLWAIFARGANGRAYNVGSDEAVDIETLARTVARVVAPSAAIEIAKQRDPSSAPERYVPDTGRIERELGVRRTVGLVEAISRTAAWHGAYLFT
ncbi:MAG: NAD-dependent epimerase/dehydratase family protein [Candidatus Eremiobacteraeota bacterium]|nr:NAD-dependent epimerase/dehydratase family protein [Candidatus Eremiobacteraeota bacterium]